MIRTLRSPAPCLQDLWVLAFGVAIAVAFAIATPAAAAGQAAGTADGFYFGPTTGSFGFDTGVSTQGFNPVSDNVISIVPSNIQYTKNYRSSTLTLSYEPRIEIYTELTELTALNHTATVRYNRSLSREWTLDLGGDFWRSKDASLQQQSISLNPRGTFMRGASTVGLTYQFNRQTSLFVRVLANYTQAPTLTLTDLISVKQLATSALTGVTRTFARDNTLTVTYAYQRSEVLNPEEVFGPTTIGRLQVASQDTLNANYSRTTRGGLYFWLGAGLLRRRLEFDNEFTYSLSGGVRKNWRNLALNGNYQRTLGGFLVFSGFTPAGQPIDPILQSRVTQRALLGARANLGRRVQIDADFSASRSKIADSRLEFVNAGATGVVQVTDRIAPFASIFYLSQRFAANSPTFSRTRILAGLRFYWERSPIGRPLNNSGGGRTP